MKETFQTILDQSQFILNFLIQHRNHLEENHIRELYNGLKSLIFFTETKLQETKKQDQNEIWAISYIFYDSSFIDSIWTNESSALKRLIELGGNESNYWINKGKSNTINTCDNFL